MPRENFECLCILLSKLPHAEYSLAFGNFGKHVTQEQSLSPEAEGLGSKDPEVSPLPPIPHTQTACVSDIGTTVSPRSRPAPGATAAQATVPGPHPPGCDWRLEVVIISNGTPAGPSSPRTLVPARPAAPGVA